MSNKILKTVAILFIAAAIPFVGWSVARADDAPGSAKCDDREFKQAVIKHHEKMLFERLKATPEQQTKLSQVFADERAAKEPLREKMHTQMGDLHDLLASSDATNDQITDKAHEMRQTCDELMDAKLSTMLKVRAILTPPQRASLAKCHDHEAPGCGREPGEPGGPPCDEPGAAHMHMHMHHGE